MSEPPQRAWRLYVDDMIRFAGRAMAYTKGMDQSAFVSNALVHDATLRNLELIGEAASRIPDVVRNAYPDIPWRLAIATRNRLIHAYLGIDDDIVWSIIKDDLPRLVAGLEAIPRDTNG